MKVITKRPNGTTRVHTVCEGKTRAHQQYKEQCDVNNIIAKYKKTGTVTHVRNKVSGVYADLTNFPSYEEAMQTIVRANHAFLEVPAKIRARFNNDPQAMIDFLTNPENDKEAIELGLKNPPPPPTSPSPTTEAPKTDAKNESKT